MGCAASVSDGNHQEPSASPTDASSRQPSKAARSPNLTAVQCQPSGAVRLSNRRLITTAFKAARAPTSPQTQMIPSVSVKPQKSKPSSRDYFDVDALLDSVESGAIAPLRGSWVVKLHEEGGRLKRRKITARSILERRISAKQHRNSGRSLAYFSSRSRIVGSPETTAIRTAFISPSWPPSLSYTWG